MIYIDQQNNLTDVINGLPPQSIAGLPESNVVFLIEEIADPFGLTMGEIGELCELVRQVITKELPVEKFEEGLKAKLSEAEDDDNLPRVPEIVWEINDKIFVKLLPALGMKALPIGPRPALPPAVAEEKYQGSTLIKSEYQGSYQGSTLIKPGGEAGAGTAPAERATPPVSTPFPSSATFSGPSASTPRPVPLKKVLPTPPRPITPPSSLPTINYKLQTNPSVPPQPLSEMAHLRRQSGPVVHVASAQTKPKPPILEASHEQMSANPTDSFLKMLSDKLSDKELKSRFDKLPYALKTALRNVDSAKRVVDIGRKYALHVDKLGTLGEETGLVILGITHPAQFLPRLSRRLGIGEEKARAIAEEVNIEVFLKIREALKQINGEPLTAASQKYQGEALIKRVAQQRAQPPEADEFLDREAILRDIENPPSTEPISASPEPAQAQTISPARKQTGEQAPAPVNLPGQSEIPPIIAQTVDNNRKPDEPALGDENSPVAHAIAERPTEKAPPAPAIPPAPLVKPPATTTQNIIDQKLSATTVGEKSESRYSEDPYREPLL